MYISNIYPTQEKNTKYLPHAPRCKNCVINKNVLFVVDDIL